jgi:cysteine desulfurase
MAAAARVYLDWNASAPLRPEARAAMAAAMDLCGNPSSVHAEGRAARALVERARVQVAEAFRAQPDEVIFTSGATEAAALAASGRGLASAAIEHDCVAAWTDGALPVDVEGRVSVADPAVTALQAANSETGVIQDLPPGLALIDAAQAAGRIPFAFGWTGARAALISGHKFGGPKGIGALLLRRGADPAPVLRGGGQEEGRRAGTENLIGIAGLGAAAEAAARDLNAGRWERVAEIRRILETALASAGESTILVGNQAPRLPNTICLVTPGWKGETQVMAMDLAGFAVSSGSACSSGKVRPSRTLAAMGLGEAAAQGAIRISLGPDTTTDEALAFARAWTAQHARHRAKAVRTA